jgi:hypothetical protein
MKGVMPPADTAATLGLIGVAVRGAPTQPTMDVINELVPSRM